MMTENEHNAGELALNGASIHYETAGQGEPLLFIHADLADRRMWENQFEAFRDSHQVIRYDLRGSGQSSPQEGDFAHREDLIALLDHLQLEQVHGIGNGEGARVLLELAALQAQRLSSLTLIAPVIEGYPWRERHLLPYETEIENFLAIAEYEQASELVAKRWLGSDFRKRNTAPPIIHKQLQEMIVISLRNRNRYEAEEKNLLPSLNDRLDEIAVNSLLVIGDLDLQLYHEMTDRLQQKLRRSRRVSMTNTAHLPSLERPEEFNWRLKHFLRRGR
ncbi:MAG: alpha/beta fold hydrolase [Anaerolineaceae bacterium]|nr:alpha/beta fold hydrolase [Anaerolineaceae bacterium]MCY3935030.1 alpha/beta fold hydrolase [Chloroflexota bacterium]MCY4008853.1 alpha/beta fold hydrolase [Anaerolineaceae bacterium]